MCSKRSTPIAIRLPRTCRLSLLLVAACSLSFVHQATAGGGLIRFYKTLNDSSTHLGAKYILTGPVGYFDVENIGTVDVKIRDVKVTPFRAGDQTFKLLFVVGDTITIQPGKFTPIGVFLDLQNVGPDSALVSVYSDAQDSVISDTLSVLGVDVKIHTTMLNTNTDPPGRTFYGHAFEQFSFPVTIGDFQDTLHDAYIQHFTCHLTYDPEVIQLDTLTLTLHKDTITGKEILLQGPDPETLRVVNPTPHDSIIFPFKAGDVYIHVSEPNSGLHQTGDTIFTLSFEVNQALAEKIQTNITTTFSGDIGFYYAKFTSDDATFITLPCSNPAKVLQAASAWFLDNHPNPFNPSTRIRYALDQTGKVQLRVYDRIGRLVATPLDAVVSGGTHELVFDASGIPSGDYYCRLVTAASSDTRMITLSR